MFIAQLCKKLGFSVCLFFGSASHHDAPQDGRTVLSSLVEFSIPECKLETQKGSL